MCLRDSCTSEMEREGDILLVREREWDALFDCCSIPFFLSGPVCLHFSHAKGSLPGFHASGVRSAQLAPLCELEHGWFFIFIALGEECLKRPYLELGF